MVIKWDQNRMLEAWLIMFSTLDTVSQDKDKGNLIAKPSLKEHQVDLNFNYDSLTERHKSGLKWGGEVTLDNNEIDMFKKCSWAAYYYLTEIKSEEQLETNAFVQMHKRLFIN